MRQTSLFATIFPWSNKHGDGLVKIKTVRKKMDVNVQDTMVGACW